MNTIDPNQEVIRIVEELKEDAAQRRRRLIDLAFRERENNQNFDDGEFNFDPVLPELQLEVQLTARNESQYKLKDLLDFDDREFVFNAYRAILKRSPDESGLRHALKQLRRGTVDKVDILAGLCASPEGREKGVVIPGLSRKIFIRRLLRLPLIRSTVKPAYYTLRLPSIAKDQQQATAAILARQDLITQYFNDNVVGRLRSITSVLQKSLRLLEEQRKTNEVVLQRISEFAGHSEERLNEEALQRQQEVRDRTAEVEDLRRVYNKYRTQVELTEKDLKREMAYLFRKHQEVKTELVFQSQRVSDLLGGAVTIDSQSATNTTNAVVSKDDRSLDAFFASFDEHFRGERNEVKQRLRTYLPILRNQLAVNGGEVLDVASGRGEWLELLKDENIPASGVDVNGVLVAQCRERGLSVTQADLKQHLRTFQPGSLGAVSAFHIVEHLSIEDLISFLDETLRALRPGGLLLIETPNPENVLVGSCNFYFDPTHRNPIPSPVLKFLVESRGFLVTETLGLNPSDEKPVASDSELAQRFNQFFYGPMDYAIVARKV